jgi:hypothetical protein
MRSVAVTPFPCNPRTRIQLRARNPSCANPPRRIYIPSAREAKTTRRNEPHARPDLVPRSQTAIAQSNVPFVPSRLPPQSRANSCSRTKPPAASGLEQSRRIRQKSPKAREQLNALRRSHPFPRNPRTRIQLRARNPSWDRSHRRLNTPSARDAKTTRRTRNAPRRRNSARRS